MDDTITLGQKKRKIVLDPDLDEEDPSQVITTRTVEEPAERELKHVDPEKKIPKKTDSTPKSGAAPNTSTPNASSKPKPQVMKSENTDKKPVKPAEKPAVVKKPTEEPKKKEEEKKKTSVVKKKPAKEESSSDSDSDSDSGSSDESDYSSEEEAKKKKKPVVKTTPKKEVKVEGKKVVKSKDSLVYEVLKRWWYCMEEWPPKNFDYSKALANNNLRKIDIKYWKIEPEEKNGLGKVYEMPSYPGLFKNSKGEVFDLRPKESCPSYENLRAKNILELCDLLATALKNQVAALEKSENCDKTLLDNLKKEMARAERNLEAQKLQAQKKV